MNVFGHNDMSGNNKLITAADLLQHSKKISRAAASRFRGAVDDDNNYR